MHGGAAVKLAIVSSDADEVVEYRKWQEAFNVSVQELTAELK